MRDDESLNSEFLTYWEEAARPLTSLAFIVPMLVAYEAGLVVLGPQSLRNGADAWLRYFLDWIGFGQYFLLPLLTCGVLLAWHHLSQERWLLRGLVLQGMVAESLAFGVLLLLLARTHASLMTTVGTLAQPPDLVWQEFASSAIAYFGAGVYEELLFRLMLLPVLIGLLHGLGLRRVSSVLGATVLTSLLFAVVHYEFELPLGRDFVLRNHGEIFDWASFSFRLMAGAFFGFLFLNRGFGIAAGAHAIYDILTAIG